MHSAVQLAAYNDILLTLEPDPDRPGMMRISLSGSDLNARATVDQRPARPDSRHLRDFFIASARTGLWDEVYWETDGDILSMTARGMGNDTVELCVRMEQTLRPDCYWTLTAYLLVSAEELNRCGQEAGQMFAAPDDGRG